MIYALPDNRKVKTCCRLCQMFDPRWHKDGKIRCGFCYFHRDPINRQEAVVENDCTNFKYRENAMEEVSAEVLAGKWEENPLCAEFADIFR